MGLLSAVPKSIFSWSFTLYQDDRPLADVDVSWFRERGQFDLAGHRFDVRRTDFWRGRFALQSEGLVLATAQKTSAFVRRFEVGYEERELVLEALHPFTRSFGLYERDRRIGAVRPVFILSRRAQISLPDDIVLPVQVFLFWLVVVLWRRANNNSAG